MKCKEFIQSNFYISNTDISKFSVYRSFSKVPTFFLYNLYEKTIHISKLYISKFSVYRSFFTSPNVHLHPNSPFIYRIPLTCTNFSRKYCEGFSHLSFADRKHKRPHVKSLLVLGLMIIRNNTLINMCYLKEQWWS